MDKTTPLTEFDMRTVPWLLQMAKAALPFFDANMQRSFAMMLRFWEFKSTIEFFKFHSLKNPVGSCSGNDVFNHGGGISFNFEYIKELASDENFQKCIEPYCPAPIFGIIRNYKMFAGMSEIFKNYADVSDVFSNFGDENNFDFSKKFENMKSVANQMQHFNSDSPTQLATGVASTTDFDNQNESSTFNPAMMYLSGAQKSMYDEYMKQLENIF
jgi:hypothetical protein